MNLDKFGALGLHEKNAYLQELADTFCMRTDRPLIELSREALSRLRRFYSRRSLADLKVAPEPVTDLDIALKALGEAVKLSERQPDIVGALKAELPPPVLREAPEDDSQMSFFVPSIYDAPLKDDVNLMDVAPFSLGKAKRGGEIRYELKDCIITIDGSASAGLATVFDYDIFLHMVTSLAEEARRYRLEQEKGLRTDLPARVYRPSTSHILKFCRRSSGGKQYKDLEAALDRLQGTRIKIVNLTGGSRREVVTMPLIQTFKVISKTTTGNIDLVEIGIPDWVYNGVVREKGNPQILTLNPEYFLITQGIGRFIYRLARRAAGKSGTARYGMKELHKRSGSTQGLPQFSFQVRQFVVSTRMFPFPDYDLELTTGKREEILIMRERKPEEADVPLGSGAGLPELPLA
ncbi:replication initiator protein A [Methylobacterium sp. E-041]|uniref:replication initiator protein A n=1 Tax=Methylobacterium sp. E-041 TaxID=2836573 RepID=UPI001FBAFDCB|nr:replication initiator protein A [Methylobacterium sp. E-041]MCJ2106632.1 replication initiator protein A [Methylobacterium sp. E-041]